MNIAEVKEMECRRRQRRLMSAMLPTFDGAGLFYSLQVPQNGGKKASSRFNGTLKPEA